MRKSSCNLGEFVVKFTSQRTKKVAVYGKRKKLGENP